MKKNVLTSVFLVAGLLQTAQAQTQFLPNWFDAENEISDGGLPLSLSFLEAPKLFRVPAEYEPIDAVLMSWRDAEKVLASIAKAVGDNTHAKVLMAGGPESIEGVPANRYTRVNCPVDTVWVRDYGPVGIATSEKEQGFVDSIYRHFQSRRNDDAFPACLAGQLSKKSYGVDLVLDGGNFLIDSAGNLFTTQRTFEWNAKYSRDQVENILHEYYGVKNIHVLNYAGQKGKPKDGTGHIDMFVKLVSDNTVIVSEASEEPFKSTVEEAARYFQSITAPNGAPYTVLRVPGWYENSTWYTYTNSLVVNGVALIPNYVYYVEQNNVAQKVYEQAGFKAIMIDSDRTIGRGGSIHCVTQTIPAVR